MAIVTSHGGHHGRGTLPNVMDVGAVGSGYLEADVAQRINKLFIKYAKCKDTTDRIATNINQNLYNIVQNMNRVAGDWHLSNHLNAFNKQAFGVEVWYKLGDVKAKAMAEKVSATIARVTGLFNRGAKATSSFYVVRNNKNRTLLIEWGFIDNAADMKKLMATYDKAVQEVAKLFGHKIGTTTPSNPVTKPSTGLAKNTKPVTNGVPGDTVKVYDALYVNSEGAGRSTNKRGSTGKIKRIHGNNKKYLIENWGWAHANDIQMVTKKTTTPKPSKPAKKYPGDNLPNKGTYITPAAMNIRAAPTTKSAIVGDGYPKGAPINYDKKVFGDGRWWVSYIASASKKRRYVAVI